MVTTKAKRPKYEYQISDQCRRSSELKKKFLKWLSSNPKFKKKKPTVEETVEAFATGALKGLVERDIEKAAKKYWRDEAQYWLRHVEVIKVNVETSLASKPVNAYVPIKRSQFGRIPEQDYRAMRRIDGDPKLTFDVVQRAKADLEAWLERYERYSEFLEAFDPVIKPIRILLNIQQKQEEAKKTAKQVILIPVKAKRNNRRRKP